MVLQCGVTQCDCIILGKPADQYFIQHPDWVPNLNLNNKEFKTSYQIKTETIKPHTDGPRKSNSTPGRKPAHSTHIDDAIHEFTGDESHKYSMPLKRCCVASCLNRMSKTKTASPSIYYHKFPEDPLFRNRWMFLCQRKGTWDPEHYYICSEHFSPDNYEKEGVLINTAVPTMKLFSSEVKSSEGKGDLIILDARPKLCSIPWCKSGLEGKKMILFPEKSEECKTWIDKIFGASVPVVPSEKAAICQDHFTPNDWTCRGKILKDCTLPSIFDLFLKTTSPNKDSVRRRGELSKDRTSIKKEHPQPDKVVKIVKLGKRQHLSDHSYFGMDSSEGEGNSETVKKEKISKVSDDRQIKLKSGYNNVEELMADLMGEDSLKENEEISKSMRQRIIDDPQDSLDDYSDYSETDSDSDNNKAPEKPAQNMSNHQLKELNEAQKYQLNDLKGENKELIEENERLRSELTLLKTDPNHASICLEKSKFLSLVVKLLKKFLNNDQILFLVKSNDPSNAFDWTAETINKALEIQTACSDKGYDLLIDTGFPLPPRRLLTKLDTVETDVNKNDN